MIDDDDRRRRPWRSVAWVAALVVAGVALWIQFDDDGGGGDQALTVAANRTSVPSTTEATTTSTAAPTTTEAQTERAPATDVEPDPTSPSSDDEPADDTDAATDDGSATEPATDAATDDGSATEPAADAAVATTVADGDAPPTTASYPTLDDGSPVPVVVIYDGDTIAISGVVPSEAASARLETLALANSAVPNASVANLVTINPDVPIGVGVRVIEMQSARFPESTATILAEHAQQLDRVVAVMSALPNITVTVVGHADQRGSEQRNYEISAERAQAVVDFIAARGIDPARLSARAVGASDLLTLNNDEVAFALNRRTEFIFYGLLIE